MKKNRTSKLGTRFFGAGLSGFCALGLGLVVLAGCNDHPVGTGARPEFRGITVPLPPPSFRGATLLDVEFQGTALGFENERALAWDVAQKQGLAGPVDAAGNFVLPAWKINVRKHCIELRGASKLGEVSSPSYYDLNLAEGPACQDAICSVQDNFGQCLCLTRRLANCVDAQTWPETGPNTGTAPAASGPDAASSAADTTSGST